MKSKMNFRSIADLAQLIRQSETLNSLDFDAVIGVPRSGMIPAAIIALLRNKPLADVDSFLEGRLFGHGYTRPIAGTTDIHSLRSVLVVDDSLRTGTSLRKAVERISSTGIRTLSGAAFVNPKYQGNLDLFLERLPHPRIFEWNMWHSWFTKRAAFDLDGIFCRDPNPLENDDGAAYERFILSVPALVRPTVRVGHIVTARLEKYRPQTEAWLQSAGIEYGQLHMLDATADERRRHRLHSKFKAKVYESTGAPLFIESDMWQAQEIATITQRPVLHYPTMTLVEPSHSFSAAIASPPRRIFRRTLAEFKRMIMSQRGALGSL